MFQKQKISRVNLCTDSISSSPLFRRDDVFRSALGERGCGCGVLDVIKQRFTGNVNYFDLDIARLCAI
jgi:hypothetical protein